MELTSVEIATPSGEESPSSPLSGREPRFRDGSGKSSPKKNQELRQDSNKSAAWTPALPARWSYVKTELPVRSGQTLDTVDEAAKVPPRPPPMKQPLVNSDQREQFKQVLLGLPLGTGLAGIPCGAIFAADIAWSLAGCQDYEELSISCLCDPVSAGALRLLWRVVWWQGVQISLLAILWGQACRLRWWKIVLCCVGIVVCFGLLALTGNESLANVAGFSILGIGFFPLVGACAIGPRAGGHAALPIVILVLYVGLIQVGVSRIYPAWPPASRPIFVAVFPLALAFLQRLARKILNRLPALRSRQEDRAGRWEAHQIATLASVFFAFGETINLAVLVSGAPTPGAVLANLALKLLTGLSARACLLWRGKRWLQAKIGRSLSLNPTKTCRKLPDDKRDWLKTRNRVSAIFLGNKSSAGYATLLAWLLYEAYGISFNGNLAASPCDSLAVFPSSLPSRHWWLLGALVASELLEDVCVKLVHRFALPCVTRRIVAPSWAFALFGCLCQLFFALTGFETSGNLLRAGQIDNYNMTNATGV